MTDLYVNYFIRVLVIGDDNNGIHITATVAGKVLIEHDSSK